MLTVFLTGLSYMRDETKLYVIHRRRQIFEAMVERTTLDSRFAYGKQCAEISEISDNFPKQ